MHRECCMCEKFVDRDSVQLLHRRGGARQSKVGSEVVRIQGATDTSSCIVEIVVESSDWRDLQLKLSRRSGGEDKSRW